MKSSRCRLLFILRAIISIVVLGVFDNARGEGMDRKERLYRGQLKKGKRIFGGKLLACFLGIMILLGIASTYINYRVKEGKAPYVTVQEILPVLHAFLEVNHNDACLGIIENTEYLSGEYVTVKDMKGILSCFPGVDISIVEEYKNDTWYVGETDWKQILVQLVQNYGAGEISLAELTLYGDESNVTGEDGTPLPEGRILTNRGVMESVFWNVGNYLYNNVAAVCYGEKLLSVIGYGAEETVLKNVYLADVSSERVHFFINHYNLYYMTGDKDIPEKERNPKVSWEMKEPTGGMVVDLCFSKGSINVLGKEVEYIHGKLLQVSDMGIEIEGYGIFKPDEEMEVYRLYSELATKDKKDLRIGYSFTDFVLEKGKVAACLMMKEEDMEYIRVLLKNSDYVGQYHDSLVAKCDQDYDVIYYRNGVEQKREEKTGGEEIVIEAKKLEAGVERVKLLPKVLSANTIVSSIVRSQGTPSYKGSIEVTATQEGLLLVNEVLLEDYLCKVVPSEMPSSYPKEALMAQAVCARTYAYGKMLSSGLPTFGAHVDDSAVFQVYNNIKEQGTTTEAVKATHNKIVQFRGTPIGTYYYSTSCGVGSDASVWHGSGENPEYLVAQVISETVTDVKKRDGEGSVSENDTGESERMDELTADDLAQEDKFRQWIMLEDESHYESDEGWYRWTYEAEELDVSHLEEVLQERYVSNPKLILTKNDDGEFVSSPIRKLGKVHDIEITRRLAGGVADELVITGSKATVKVVSELNIRYVLSDGKTKVLRRSGDLVNASATIPSAFCIIDLDKEKDTVTGYKIIGGGFGHGVGMSQNGARNMADAGLKFEDILTYFYPGVEIKTLQFGE